MGRYLPVVVARGGKNVEHAARRDRPAGMRHVGWDYQDSAGGQPVGDPAGREFQLAFENVDNLLVRVLMFGEAGARVRVDPRF